MSSSFRKTVEKLAEQMGGGASPPCRTCSTPTQAETLSRFGGNCGRCHDGYCAAGLSGGPTGFMTGRGDTPQQAEMRKAMRGKKPENVLNHGSDELDPDRVEKAKREAERRVAEYAARTGQPA